MGDNVVMYRINPSDKTAAGIGKPVPDFLLVSQSRNRNIAAAATTWAAATNTVTWPSPGVYSLSITVNLAAAASVTGALFVFDAPNDAVAASWLADAGGAGVDVAYAVVLNAQRVEFMFSAPITRLDVLALGAACRILVEAN